MEDSEKAQLGTATIVGFFQQFGDDDAALILLEELFKGLINEEALFVFGEPLEERDQTGDGSPERVSDHIENHGSGEIESAIELATPDLPDYP
jgi:hypothetical protein